MDNLKIQQLELLDTAYEYMGRLLKGIEQITYYFDIGEYTKGNQLLSEFIEGYDWLLQALELTQTLHQHLISFNNIEEIVEPLLEAIENKDYVLIKDILQYEIKEQISVWIMDVEKVIL